MNDTQWIEFVMFLTGNSEETVKQMMKDYFKYK